MRDKSFRYQSIKERLKELEITQQEFAEMLGISFSGLQHRFRKDADDLHLSLRGVECVKGNAKRWRKKFGI